MVLVRVSVATLVTLLEAWW
jgi:hypothetical protein